MITFKKCQSTLNRNGSEYTVEETKKIRAFLADLAEINCSIIDHMNDQF